VESKIHLIPESSFNQTLSKPESDLGSPETEDLVSETSEQDKKEETPVTQEIQKGSTG